MSGEHRHGIRRLPAMVEAILNMLPLQQFQLGWIIPALAGLLIGVLDSAAHSSFKR